MHRRTFIKTSSALVASAGLGNSRILYASDEPSTVIRAGILSIPDTLKEEFLSFQTLEELESYRDQLFASCIRLDGDAVCRTIPGHATMCIQRKTDGYHAWALFIENNKDKELLGYLDANFPFLSGEGFIKWLIRFSPSSWDDLVLASAAYPNELHGVFMCELPHRRAHSWLDNLLNKTRGLLFYQYQGVAILRRACVAAENPSNWLNAFSGTILMRWSKSMSCILTMAARWGKWSKKGS
jgi:hypothetical protein